MIFIFLIKKIMTKGTNSPQVASSVSKEVLRSDWVKGKNLYRTTSDNLSEIFNLWLRKWNVIIIDWLKYHFNWKDMFVIDKNAKKSADIQWKKYRETITLYDRKYWLT